LNKSNGSPLYLLIGPENLTKKSRNLETIAQFITDNFELEEIEIISENKSDLSPVIELKQILQNFAREELCSFGKSEIFSDWS